MTKEKDDDRVRNFACTRNYWFETHDENGAQISEETPNEWKSRVDTEIRTELGADDSCIYIFHEYDKNDDGTFKDLHVHFLLMFKNPQRQLKVMERFKISSPFNCQGRRKDNKPTQILDSARYMIHITDKAINDEKYIYSSSDVVSIHCKFEHLIKTKSKKVGKISMDYITALCHAIRSGELKVNQAQDMLEDNFGDDGNEAFHKNFAKFERERKRFFTDKKDDLILNNRDLKNIYIVGVSQSGKSMLAKQLAIALGNGEPPFKSAVKGQGKTSDFISGYNSESVTIIEEVEGDMFGFREFNANFDDVNFNTISSRIDNKVWLSNYCIFTTTEEFDEFSTEVCMNGKKNSNAETLTQRIIQVQRRFTYIIEVEKTGSTESKVYIKKRKLFFKHGAATALFEPVKVFIMNKQTLPYIITELTEIIKVKKSLHPTKNKVTLKNNITSL